MKAWQWKNHCDGLREKTSNFVPMCSNSRSARKSQYQLRPYSQTPPSPHPAVTGDQIAGGKDCHISRHHLREWYLQELAVPQHPSAHRHGLAQTFRCLSGPVCLDEIEGHTDEDDGADDEEAGGVTGKS